MDFAFAPDGATHYHDHYDGLEPARKSYHAEEWLSVEGYVTSELATSHSCHTFLSQFNDYVRARKDGEFIPVTDGGARLADLERVPPEDALAFCDQYPVTDWRRCFCESTNAMQAELDTSAQVKLFKGLARDFLRYRKLLKEADSQKQFLDVLLAFLKSDSVMLGVSAFEDVFHSLNQAKDFRKQHMDNVRDRLDDLAPHVKELLEI